MRGRSCSIVSREILRTSTRMGERRKEVAAAATNIMGSPIMGVVCGHWRPTPMSPTKTTKGRRTFHHPIPAGGSGSSVSAFSRSIFSPFQPRRKMVARERRTQGIRRGQKKPT